METPKEVQLEILDKMKENIINDLTIYEGIETLDEDTNEWRDTLDCSELLYFENYKYRVKS